MIRLEQQRSDAAQQIPHRGRRSPEIVRQPESRSIRAYDKRHGLSSVVSGMTSGYGKRADRQGFVRCDTFARRAAESIAERCERPARGIDRTTEFPSERRGAARVVSVFVREDDAYERPQIDTGLVRSLDDGSRAEARIEQQRAAVGRDDERVTSASRTQHR